MPQCSLTSICLHLFLLCAVLEVRHATAEAIEEFSCSEELSFFDRKLPQDEGWLVQCGACDPFDCYNMEGTGLYAPDGSSCCCAAIHNGTITAADGGLFRVFKHRHKNRYQPKIKGSIQNGVYTSDYKPSKVSYRIGKFVPSTTTTTTTMEPTTTEKIITTTTTEPTPIELTTTTTTPVPTITTTTATAAETDIKAERQDNEETPGTTSRLIISPTLVSELNQNERLNSTSSNREVPPQLEKIIPNITARHTMMNVQKPTPTSTILPVIINHRRAEDDSAEGPESSAKPSHAEMMWLVKGLFFGAGFCVFLLVGVCAGRRIKRNHQSSRARAPKRRTQGQENEGCVCYIAMDAAEQFQKKNSVLGDKCRETCQWFQKKKCGNNSSGDNSSSTETCQWNLMFDPETCERPCTMRKQLLAGVFDEEEEDVKTADPTPSTTEVDNCQKACEDCTGEHCTTQNEKFAF